MVNEHGIIDAIKFHYENWCTRYFALLVSFSVASLYKYGIILILYQLSLLILIAYSIFKLIKNGAYFINEHNKHSNFQFFNYAIFIVSGIFYSTFNIAETWFWLSSNSTYLLSIIALVYSVSIIINKKNNLITYIGLIISMLFIGGSNGSLSFFLLMLAGIAIPYFYIKEIQHIKEHFIIKKTLFSTIILLIGFTILYIGPGNEVRSSFFESSTIFQSMLHNFKYCGIILLQKVPSILCYLIVFSIPFLLLGTRNKKNINEKMLNKVLITTGMLAIFIYLFQLPITYKTQDIAADRTLFPLCLLIYCYCCYIFYQIGTYSTINNKTFQILLTISITTALSINCFNLMKQYPIVKKYAYEYDNRLQYINSSKNSKLITLPPLPSSGYIYSNEISKDSTHFTNQHLKNGLFLECEIILQ